METLASQIDDIKRMLECIDFLVSDDSPTHKWTDRQRDHFKLRKNPIKNTRADHWDATCPPYTSGRYQALGKVLYLVTGEESITSLMPASWKLETSNLAPHLSILGCLVDPKFSYPTDLENLLTEFQFLAPRDNPRYKKIKDAVQPIIEFYKDRRGKEEKQASLKPLRRPKTSLQDQRSEVVIDVPAQISPQGPPTVMGKGRGRPTILDDERIPLRPIHEGNPGPSVIEEEAAPSKPDKLTESDAAREDEGSLENYSMLEDFIRNSDIPEHYHAFRLDREFIYHKVSTDPLTCVVINKKLASDEPLDSIWDYLDQHVLIPDTLEAIRLNAKPMKDIDNLTGILVSSVSEKLALELEKKLTVDKTQMEQLQLMMRDFSTLIQEAKQQMVSRGFVPPDVKTKPAYIPPEDNAEVQAEQEPRTPRRRGVILS